MAIQRREFLSVVGSGAAAGLAGCTGLFSDEGGNGGDGDGGSGADIEGEELVLTTTTSTYDTGLLDEVNAAFEERFGTPVQAISQGTGAALETARSGDADVIMVHARSQEDEFMEEGHGVNRRDLMFNDFVIVGPADDPAGIEGTEGAEEAFATIAENEALFASRGDDSGTHGTELGIWEESGVEPGGEWYLETGQGMGDTLNQASQQGGYTLADRGTFISQQEEIELGILVEGPVEGGPELLANPYGIVAANPAVHEDRNYDLAMGYIGFLTGQEGQDVIENYELDGEQLFFPEAISEDPNFGQYVPEDWQPDGGTEAGEDETDT
ncbi:substrate-binding domain-containing protein [Halalkalicoccus tibetensis]|uniref:Substrate-binding domain-containing protein n=1 Tax=Halalkalicoccus tibetensis TaxID=175632 RepID=A0ABD5V537_9EURY